jgi:hypothetical protein
MGHAHAPFVHCWPPLHAVAQAPQCIESVCRSTHALLQFVSIGPESVAHVSTQVPSKQLGVAAGHATPQPPQFFGSVLRLTQTLLHAASGEQTTPLSVIASVTGGPSVPVSWRTVPSLGDASPPEGASMITRPSGRTRPIAPSGSLTVPSSSTSASGSSMPGSVRPHPSTIAATTHVTKHTYKKKRRLTFFMAPHPPPEGGGIYHCPFVAVHGHKIVQCKSPP